ncbi:non-ribosomal peptide synthetase [Amycolatopsis azurea DSM 43854]|uniref:Long-chain-fatty-acid--CoA ligase n=2 Tax=Amycolatopsis azurea TaxID=36819 RepID=M2PVJ8_9PSEU|nr:Long-chain-fatty-acid--CoA ligase [Amycolatopsis azurea DSM 43854]OOC08330.1 non-ribosomal peptide synthetase [Amycolatopsis azurea DSM 43854]
MERKLPAKGISDIYALSPIQQGLLYEQLGRPGTGVYIEQLRLTFEETVDPALFEQAWQAVVDRHPILRTSFHWKRDGTPLQVVHGTARLPLEVLDWRSDGPARQDERLDAWMERERLEGFDLAAAPLMRTTLIRRADEEWVFAWRFSHLLMDGWSFTLCIQDFTEAYRALRRDAPTAAAAGRPYRDYLSWWHGRDPDADAAFWESELDGYEPPPPLRMGGGAVEAGESTHSFLEQSLADLAPGLTGLARAERLTLATIAQGAWMVVLGRYLGREDVVCGITTAHRPGDLPGAEAILGPMIATVPVRERLRPGLRLRDWLRGFGKHAAEVREHHTMPLARIQARFGDHEAAPLLQSSASYENVPMPDFDLSDVGTRITGLAYDGRPHYPITMVIMPGDDMPLRVVYDRRCFADDVARRFADDLVAVLRQLVDEPEATLGGLAFTGTTVPGRRPAELVVGEPTCLHEAFTEHARRTPDAVAVSDGGREFTYGELDRYADAVAAALISAGAPGRIGLCLGRSADLVAAMIGCFKAGAAYVALDPAYPAERLRDILADSGAEVVLCTDDVVERLSGYEGRTLELGIDIRPDAEVAEVPVARDPETPAYLLYTSGSTGSPKAVVVTHRNVGSLLAAGRAVFGFDGDDVWTFAHSFAFDYSVWEIWGALANGGRLVVVPPAVSRDPAALRRLVHAERVSVFSMTPAVFEQVAAQPGEEMSALRKVFLGGDRLDTTMVRAWFDRYADADIEVYNLYGVTEATVVSTYHRVWADDIGTVPIGRPLPNQRAEVLDAWGRPVPEGGTGELWVSGPAVAAGYHAREELTARRFGVTEAGERSYRTGDLVRAREDGALCFLGRADDQVKVRGFRVEPGEIEAVLRAHPAVRSAAVVVRGPGRSARLAGYLVAFGAPVSTEDIRAYAAKHLPAHMVPDLLGWIPDIPVTESGKVNSRVLPELEHREAVEFVAPRTEDERVVAAEVAKVLELDRVGALDRLDVLGLHSLHAMRLMAALRSASGVEVPLPKLVRAGTVSELAAAVAAGRAAVVGGGDRAW